MSFMLWNQGVYRQWSEQDDNTLADMAGKCSPTEIARVLNRSKRAIYCRAQLLAISLKYHARHKPVVTSCHQLHQQGKSFTAIAKILGIPSGSVSAYLNKYTSRGTK